MTFAIYAGLSPEEVEEVQEAERETAEYEAQREAHAAASGGKPSKDKKYYWKNRVRRRHEAAMYRAKQLGALPDDLTDAEKQQILDVFEAAESLSFWTGIKHEVDHIVPLVGKNKDGDVVIRGKHVPENLRAIPWSLNRMRGNWFFIRDLERKRPSRARAEREREEQDRREWVDREFDAPFLDDGEEEIPF